MGVSDYRKGWDGVGISRRREVDAEEMRARKRILKEQSKAKVTVPKKPGGGK
jgi:hypothetical protein